MNANIPDTAQIVLQAMERLDTLGTHEGDGTRDIQLWVRKLVDGWGPHTTQSSQLRGGRRVLRKNNGRREVRVTKPA
jgi:hypothetical protein